MAAHANHHLAVFDGATGQALALYRAKRVASPRSGSCSSPATAAAPNPAAPSAPTAAKPTTPTRTGPHGGNTNVDEMTLACGPDNRDVDDDGWQTRINTRGECEWRPPPDLDHGQSRINYYHRPEALLDHPKTTTPTPPHGTSIPARHPADPNHPTTKQHESRWKPLLRRPGGHHNQLVRARIHRFGLSTMTMTDVSMRRKRLLGSHIGQFARSDPPS